MFVININATVFQLLLSSEHVCLFYMSHYSTSFSFFNQCPVSCRCL